MWGVCDIAWLTFLWTFYFPAVAPPFSRSAPRLHWSLIVCPRTEKLSKKRAQRRCVFYGMLTNSYRVNARFNHRNFALPCVLRFYTLLFQLLAFIVAFIEGCRKSTRFSSQYFMFCTRFVHTICMFLTRFIPFLSCVFSSHIWFCRYTSFLFAFNTVQRRFLLETNK